MVLVGGRSTGKLQLRPRVIVLRFTSADDASNSLSKYVHAKVMQ